MTLALNRTAENTYLYSYIRLQYTYMIIYVNQTITFINTELKMNKLVLHSVIIC